MLEVRNRLDNITLAMENTTRLLTTLVIRLNAAENTLLSQVYDDHPASPAECLRAHDRLLGAWSTCLSVRYLFNREENARLESLEERTTFAARNLRAIR